MVSQEFKQNVESEDLVTVRSALVDYLIIDRTFEKFDEALEFALAKLSVLQPYDNNPFETEAEKWDKEYLNHQKVALMINFSKHRITHIKEVIQKVLPKNNYESAKSRTVKKVTREEEEIKVGPTRKKNKKKDKIGNAMILGGSLVSVVGLAIEQPLVVGTGIVIVGTGIGLKVKDIR